jgi:dTDP-4-dehydrorhamnose 3,5-epimerase
MIFRETKLAGVFVIEAEPVADERGHFARTFCAREFADHGIESAIAQCSLSFNKRKGTLRGLHYQAPPHNEAKLVRATSGGIYDVAVDLREGSSTYGQWAAAELTAENRRMFFIPKGCAHGFQTLRDDSEILYQIAERYEPASARGVRWDDPELAIAWPDKANPILSDRDRAFPGLRGVEPIRL